MTLQQLHYVIAISDAGSMNKAAEQLFVSQPSISNAIQELEDEIGITIFYRNSRGVTLSNEGSEFLSYARRVFQQYEILENKYSGAGNVKKKFGVSTQHYSFVVKAFVETVKKFGTLSFDFAIRETRTMDVITDVGRLKSEIGILFINDMNRKIITKLIRDNDLQFVPLIKCRAYVYLWKGHPLAEEKEISIDMLEGYPCLSFEQGEEGSIYLSEEILSEKEYLRSIHACDRATMLNLMIGLNGYTLCSGIISEELNGTDYVTVPYKEDKDNLNSTMEIGYIVKQNFRLSETGEVFIDEIKKYLSTCERR